MKTLLLLLLSTASAPAVADTYVITANLGGPIQFYEDLATNFMLSNTKVIIKGICASACAELLKKKYLLNICALPSATLQFHMNYWVYNYGKDGAFIDTKKTRVVDSFIDWQVNWLGQFDDGLNLILETATDLNLIPNPSQTGNANEYYTLPAIPYVKECGK